MSHVYRLADQYPSIQSWQEELRARIHRHPELGMKETVTSQTITDEVTALGLGATRLGPTGVVSIVANGEGPTVLARTDMDALPVHEDTGLPFTSEVDGIMHACGHDMHVAALLGALKLMSENRDEWKGTYIALFQPAEETAEGAKSLLDAGLIEAVPAPDVCFAQHVMPGAPAHVLTRPGPAYSAADSLKITVFGSGAHGSMPHMSVDPVVAACSMVTRIQTIIARELAPGTFAVVTVGSIQAGTTSNIIPDRATMLLNIRTYDPAVRNHVLHAIERICVAEAHASQCPRDPEFEYYDQFPLTVNDRAVHDRVRSAFEEFFEPGIVGDGEPVTASEDFSRVPDAWGAPYLYWNVTGTVDPDRTDEPLAANHSPFFAPVMQPTLRVMTQTHIVAALAYMNTDRS